jgi:hypothetical protein
MDEGLISEIELEHHIQEKEEQQYTHPVYLIPDRSALIGIGVDSPKWGSVDFSKYNIDKPLELFMDLSHE